MPIRECPSCQIELEIPDGTAPGKKIRCPDCDETFVLPGPKPKPTAKKPIQVMEVIEDDEDEKPRNKSSSKDTLTKKKKKKKKVRREEKPFWQTRQGMMLNGLGLIGLGIGGIAVAYFTDSRKKIGIMIAGGLCILFGIGAIGKGLAGGEDSGSNDDND